MGRGWKPALLAISASLLLAESAFAATVTPSSHDYGTWKVGTAGVATTFTLQTSPNDCLVYGGTCSLSTSYATDTTALGGSAGGSVTSGDFLIHNLSCPYPSFPSPPSPGPNFGPPGSCQFEVSFAPVASGARSLTLSFTDSGGTTGTLNLTGTGLKHKSCKKRHHHRRRCKKHR